MTQPPLTTQVVPSDSTAKIVYVLYLLSLLFGVTALVGVVIAYVNVGDAPEPLKNHYRFQIRTFWIGLLYACVSALATFFVVGVVLAVLAVVWFIVRCVKGLKYLGRGEPYPNAGTWLW
jgi:uncharacterized membrane protein